MYILAFITHFIIISTTMLSRCIYICCLNKNKKFMKEKILSLLKTKNPGVAKEVLEAVAALLAVHVTEESAIEEAVNNGQTILASFQSETDRRVNSYVAEIEKLKAKPPVPKSEEKKDDQPAVEEPAWAKALREEVAQLKAEKQGTKLRETAQKLLSEKKVSDKFYGRLLKDKTFKDEADAEAFAKEVIADWETLVSEESNDMLTKMPKPTTIKNKAGVTSTVEDWLNTKDTAKEQPLGGKKLINN